MAGKKSKNNPENRNKRGEQICGVCKDALKPTLYVNGNKRKMCLVCKCGVHDKKGNKIA